MPPLPFITKCLVWMAALLAPSQAIFAMSQACDHCLHHPPALHHHDRDAHCTHAEAEHSHEGSHCDCRRRSQPQQPGATTVELPTDLAVAWHTVDAGQGVLSLRTHYERRSPAERHQRALDTSARLCRFRL